MEMRTFKAYREAVHQKIEITVNHIRVVSNSFHRVQMEMFYSTFILLLISCSHAVENLLITSYKDLSIWQVHHITSHIIAIHEQAPI